MNQLDHTAEGRIVSGDHMAFAIDLAGNFRMVNQAAEDATGYSAYEFARLNVLDLLPGKCLDDLRALAKRSIGRRFGTVFEVEITARTGRRIPVEVSINLVRRADGTLEFRGIAVLNGDDSVGRRPRCLDDRFRLGESKQPTAQLRT